jgi:hypothetical protein
MVNSEPLPISLATEISPPIIWQKRRLIANPKPVPATGSDGRIYALGGDGFSDIGQTVEAYDPSTDTWTPVAPMSIRRVRLAAVSGAGKIYALGGYVADVVGINSVEVYDPVTNAWSAVAPMPNPPLAR